jgi:hypothetical protein
MVPSGVRLTQIVVEWNDYYLTQIHSQSDIKQRHFNLYNNTSHQKGCKNDKRASQTWFPYMKIAQFFFLGQNGSLLPPFPRRRMLTRPPCPLLPATLVPRHRTLSRPPTPARLAAARSPAAARLPDAVAHSSSRRPLLDRFRAPPETERGGGRRERHGLRIGLMSQLCCFF